MRYGLSLYNGGTFNQQVFTVSGVVEVNAVINQTLRLRNVAGTGVAVCAATAGVRADCYASASGNVVAVAQAAVRRARITQPVGTVDVAGLAVSTALCLAAAQATVSVAGQARPGVLRCGRAVALVIVGATAVSRATCFVGLTALVPVTGTVSRTRVKYTSFGQAVAIRAAYNEGIRVASAGVLHAAQGSLEWLVQPYSVAASSPRYLFDGGGAPGQNLTVVITTDGRVQVTCGPVTIVSPSTVSGDGATWIGVSWNQSTGVELYLDGQLVASSAQQFTLSFGADFYVGCSASQVNSLDGLLDEFRVSSRRRSAAEFAAAYEAGRLGLPLEWDIDTTYLLHFDGDLNVPADRQGVWVSPVMDASQATDLAFTVIWQDEVGLGSAVVCQARTSPDGISWSAWYDQVNDELSTAPENPFVQVRFILQVVGNAATPVLHSISVVFEGLPDAQQLLAGLSQATVYGFAQLQDWLVVFNGADVPKKYDGNTISDIASGPRGKVACVYKNRVWTARGNTLYFSDLLSVDTWPVANFIMVNPSDGDEIMALIPTSMMLIIVKQRSTYYLQGYSPDTFEVSSAIDGGTVSPYGAIWTPAGIFMVDRDGVWQTDFRKRANLVRPIQSRWERLNQRALHRAALMYKDGLLLVAVPGAGSRGNNVILAYDTLHEVWVGEWTGWEASCFLQFWESGKWKYLFGGASAGNVYEVGNLSTDDGVPFEALVETAYLSLAPEEWVKRLKWADVYIGAGRNAGDVEVAFVVDGVASGYQAVSVPSGSTVTPARFYPPPYAHTVGVRVRWPRAEDNGPELLGISITSYPRAPRPVEVV